VANRVAECRNTSKERPKEPRGKRRPKSLSEMIKWPELLTGKNSVAP